MGTKTEPLLVERLAALGAALLILGLTGFLLIRNEPLASEQLFFALRLVLSLAAAVLGATVPGFLNLEWKGGGLVLRAGGALALFVLTFVYTPDLGGGPTSVSAPGGVAAGAITNSPITIQNAAPPPAVPR
jgi:hypothetical protein